MRGLFVWDSDYPWDIRVEKICTTLLENGWEVDLVCRNRLRRPLEDTYNGVYVHRLPFLGDALGSFNSWVRLATGVLFGLGIVWFSFPYIDLIFQKGGSGHPTAKKSEMTEKAIE